MRNKLSIFIFVIFAAALIAAAGCKTRDAKREALLLGPVAPQTSACGSGNLEGTITLDGCSGYMAGTASGDAVFNDCESDSVYQEVVYSITLTETTMVNFTAESTDDNCIMLSVRSNCDPNDPAAVIGCFNDHEGGSYGSLVLSPGTYYVAMDSLHDYDGSFSFELYVSVCQEN